MLRTQLSWLPARQPHCAMADTLACACNAVQDIHAFCAPNAPFINIGLWLDCGNNMHGACAGILAMLGHVSSQAVRIRHWSMHEAFTLQ